MTTTLVLDICEKPKFSVFAEHQLIFCSDFKSYSLASTLEEVIKSFNVTEVKCMVKPVSVDVVRYFPLAKTPAGFVNVSAKDVNVIVSLCKQNDIDKVSFVSYLSYYGLMRKGATIVLDYTYGDKMIAVVYDNNGPKAVHIDNSDNLEKILRDRYKVGEEDKYTLVNARQFRLDDLYPELISNYEKSMDKYSSSLSPAIFCYVERNTTDLAETVNEVAEPEKIINLTETLSKEEEDDDDEDDEEEEEVPRKPNRTVQKTKSGTKKSTQKKPAPKKKPSSSKKKKKVKQEEESSVGSFIFNFINVILGLVLGVSIVLAYQLPSDLAGLHDYLFAVRQQTDTYSSFSEMADRVSKSEELDSAKLEFIYRGIQSCPIDGIIGRVDISGDNIELELYLNEMSASDQFTSYLGSVMNILNTQDQGSISVGDKTMFKVVILGQINY